MLKDSCRCWSVGVFFALWQMSALVYTKHTYADVCNALWNSRLHALVRVYVKRWLLRFFSLRECLLSLSELLRYCFCCLSLSLNWFSLPLLISSPSIVKGPSPDQRDCVTLTKLEEQTQRERERWNWNKTANTIKKGNDGKFLEMIFFIWRRKNFGLSTAQSGVIQCRKRLSWRVTQ
jgi:hypothetical protein